MKRDIEVLQNKNKELEKFIETLDISVMKAQVCFSLRYRTSQKQSTINTRNSLKGDGEGVLVNRIYHDYTEAYLEHSRRSRMEIFCENS